jgi:hypothetical protein
MDEETRRITLALPAETLGRAKELALARGEALEWMLRCFLMERICMEYNEQFVVPEALARADQLIAEREKTSKY